MHTTLKLVPFTELVHDTPAGSERKTRPIEINPGAVACIWALDARSTTIIMVNALRVDVQGVVQDVSRKLKGLDHGQT